MKALGFTLALIACSGSQHPDTTKNNTDPVPVYKDSRSPLEKRRDTACEHIQPKLTQCALADADLLADGVVGAGGEVERIEADDVLQIGGGDVGLGRDAQHHASRRVDDDLAGRGVGDDRAIGHHLDGIA